MTTVSVTCRPLRRSGRSFSNIGPLGLAAWLFGSTLCSFAADQVVVNNAASGAGSLRQAIIDVGTGETITFDASLSGLTIGLGGTELAITKSLNIDASALVDGISLSGGNASRVMTIGSGVTVKLTSLTLRDGRAATGANATGYGLGGIGGGSGGGILNAGTLTLERCSILYCRAGDGGNGGVGVPNPGSFFNPTTGGGGGGGGFGGSGGGLYSSGSVIIDKCTFYLNYAGSGGRGGNGGIGYLSDGPGGRGGGGGFGGAIYTSGAMSLLSATVSSNQAGAAGLGGASGSLFPAPFPAIPGSGGGVYRGSNNAILNNNLIAQNLLVGGGSGPDVYGSVISQGYNLVGNAVGSSGWRSDLGDLLNLSPLIGGLANNGGPTPTMALLSGSPAIDAGDPTLTGTDQRGQPRLSRARPDIGAFEAPPLPAEISVEQPLGVDLVDGGSSAVDYRYNSIGTTSSRTFTIRNELYRADLTGVAVTIDGAGGGDFTVSSPPPATISGGSSGTFVVEFIPSESGIRSAVIHISSNDSNENPFDISAVGFGIEDGIGLDLSGTDLEGADLSGSDLTGVISGGITGTPLALPDGWLLRGGYLIGPGANLSGADLSGIDFSGADLTRANLSGSSITAAQLSSATATAGVNLVGLDFFGADLSGIDFTGAALSGVNLSGSNITLAQLVSAGATAGVNLSGLDFSGRDVSGLDFSGANLTGVDLSGSTFTAAQLLSAAATEGVNLSGLDLSGMDLSGVDFTGADLTGVSLAGSGITAVQLVSAATTAGVNLTGSDLSGADLRSVDFTRADLTRVNLTGATITQAQLLTAAVTTEVNLSGFDFSGADLSGLNLGTADLTDADLSGAYAVVSTAEDEQDIPSGGGVGISLREALRDAPAGIRVLFDDTLSGGTIALAAGELIIERSVEIDAETLTGGLAINGGNASRLVYINGGQTVVLHGLTLTGGNGEGSVDSGLGGAINNRGTLTVTRCTLSGNTGVENGGGIANGGVMTMTQCTLSGNTAGVSGGGIANSGTLTLVQCTLSENAAASQGGGVVNGGALALLHCIVAQNVAGVVGVDLSTISGGNITTDGVNFVGDPVGSGLFANLVLLTGDALLAPLGDYGGPTQTMRPLLASPAIDVGGGDTSLMTDQRGSGYARLLNGQLDLGAIETSVYAESATRFHLLGNFSPEQLEANAQWEIAGDPAFTTSASVETFANPGVLSYPGGVATDRQGNIYFADLGDDSIRKIDGQGTMTTVAGGGGFGYRDGAAATAKFSLPAGLAVADNGTVYVADTFNHCIRVISPAGVVRTLAGYGRPGYLDGTASGAWFNSPMAITIAPDGNLYVADTYNHRIRKVTPAGLVSTVAGSGDLGFAGATNAVAALEASFNSPLGVVVSFTGDIFVSDSGNNAIRRVDASTGEVTTYATNLLNAPAGITRDGAGRLYVANQAGHEILQIKEGVVTRLAGTGTQGFTDNTDPLQAMFRSPSSVAINELNGNLLVADTENHRIRRVVFSKTTVPATGPGGAGIVTGLEPGTTYYFRWLTLLGVGTTQSFVVPRPTIIVRNLTGGGFSVLDQQTPAVEIAAGGQTFEIGNQGDYPLTISEIVAPPGYRVTSAPGINRPWVIAPGSIRTLELMPTTSAEAGMISILSDEVAVSSGLFQFPIHPARLPGVLAAGTGQLTDDGATFTGSISANGGVVTNVTFELSTDPRMKDSWSLRTLLSTLGTVHDVVVVPGSGDILVSEPDQNRVSWFSADGQLEDTITGFLDHPTGLAVNSDGNLFIADQFNHRIIKYDLATKTATTLAGGGAAGFADGLGSQARFLYPTGLDVDAQGNVYVADRDNHRIRKITAAGAVTTIAGSGLAGFTDGDAAGARFNGPLDVAVSSTGALYVADGNNHAVRLLTTTGQVNTRAGSGTAGFLDAVGRSARFSLPSGLAVDANGEVYVADRDNHQIRRIELDGMVRSIAGSGVAGLKDSTPGRLAPATTLLVGFPSGIIFEETGNLLIADNAGPGVRRLTRELPMEIVVPGHYVGNTTFDFEGGGGPGRNGLAGWQVVTSGIGNDEVFSPNNQPVMPVSYASETVQGEWMVRTAQDRETGVLSELSTGVIRTDAFVLPAGAIIDFLVGGGYHPWNVMDPDALAAGPACFSLEREVGPGDWETVFTATGGNSDSLSAGQWNAGAHAGETVRFAIYDLNTTGHIDVDDIRLTGDAAFVVNADFPAGWELVPGGTYYTRLRVSNRAGSTVGEIQSFTTLKPEIAVHDGSDDAAPLIVSHQADAVRLAAGPVGPITRAFTIANQGSYELTVTSITSRARQFTILNPPTTVAAFGSETFQIRLDAARSGRYGTEITITSDDLEEGDFSFTLTGQLVDAPTVETLASETLNPGSVTLRATVNPEDSPTAVWFAYSPYADLSGPHEIEEIPVNLSLIEPRSIAMDGAGNVYLSDTGNHRILKRTTAGTTSVLAGGSGVSGFLNGNGAAARFNSPTGLHIDQLGNVFVADTGNHAIRKISPAGVVTTVAGTGTPGQTEGVASAARFRSPEGVAVDSVGNVMVADTGNHKIRWITPIGEVSTIAGTGLAGFTDGAAGNALFNAPLDLAITLRGDVIIADGNNQAIRILNTTGQVSTLAGNGTVGSTDGVGGAARFSSPTGLALDSSDNVYLADRDNHRIRMVTPAGAVSTTALLGLADAPTGVAVRSDGTLRVVNEGSGRLLKLRPSTLWVSLPSDLVGSELQSVAVTLVDLPGTDYSYRVVAVNAGGTSYGDILTLQTRFDSWVVTYFGPNPSSVLAGLFANPDADRFNNLQEYAFDLDPNVASSAGGPEGTLEGDFLTLTYRRRTDAADLRYEVVGSSDLRTWNAVGVTEEILPGNPTPATELVRARIPLGGDSHKFIRVTVTQE